MELEVHTDDVDSIDFSDTSEDEVIKNGKQAETGLEQSHQKDVYVAAGLYTDCENLLKKFLSLKTSTFEDFVKLWKEMKFAHVFLGKDSYAEVLEFTEEALTISKSFILPPHSQIKRIGGLYLMYGLYSQQPSRGFIKYRITPQEWGVILKFVENLKIHGFIDANYVFHKMCLEGAFLTVGAGREFGLERNYRKYVMPWPVRDKELDPCKTFSLETLMSQVYRGSLKAAADKCRIRYNKIKQLLEANEMFEFHGVHGTERPVDEVMQLDLVSSGECASSSGGIAQESSSIGDRRESLRHKAFCKGSVPQNAQGVPLQGSTTSSSHGASSEGDSDSEFPYMINPAAMRNRKRKTKRTQKQDRGARSRKKSHATRACQPSSDEVADQGRESERQIPSLSLDPVDVINSESIQELFTGLESSGDTSTCLSLVSSVSQSKQKERIRKKSSTTASDLPNTHCSKQTRLKGKKQTKVTSKISKKKL